MKTRRHIAVRLLLIGLLSALPGCDPVQRSALLSFFFDGVPDSLGQAVNAPADSLIDTLTAGRGRPGVVQRDDRHMHPPYQDGSCATCHGPQKGSALAKSQPALCYGCHDDFGAQYAFLHGPVAAGYCTACHEPHFGTREKLLKRVGRDLCLFCHRLEDVAANDVHESIDDADCMSCHNPHGGGDRFLM